MFIQKKREYFARDNIICKKKKTPGGQADINTFAPKKKAPRYLTLEYEYGMLFGGPVPLEPVIAESAKGSAKVPPDNPDSLRLLQQQLIQAGILNIDLENTAADPRDNPLRNVDFRIAGRLNKDQLRQFWIWQMRRGECYCSICGKKIDSAKKNNAMHLTFEHRVPNSRGGKSDSTNGEPAHGYCNGLKSNHMPEKWTLIGLEILGNHGISVDFENCTYNYLGQYSLIPQTGLITQESNFEELDDGSGSVIMQHKICIPYEIRNRNPYKNTRRYLNKQERHKFRKWAKTFVKKM